MKVFAFCLCVVLVTAANAETLELEGKVKSIDRNARVIVIARKTPKGEKILELEVAKNAGDLTRLNEDDLITFTYNPDVEIISKIEMTDAGSVEEFDSARLVMAVAFHPDGKQFAFESDKCLVRLAGTQSDSNVGLALPHALLRELKHNFITALAISANGKLLASAANDGSVQVWDISGKKAKKWDAISKNTGIVTPICFSPDSKLLATAERASGITRLFDVAGDRAVPKAVLAPLEGEVWSLAFSPDGSTLAAGMLFTDAQPPYGEVVLWDLTARPPTRTVLVPRTGLPRDLHFTPDGKSLLFGDKGLVRRLSIPDGKPIGVFDCYPSDSAVISLAVSPDGRHLAVGGTPNEVKVLEIATGDEVALLQNDYQCVEGLAFSSDGTSLLIGSKDKKVRVWKPRLVAD